MIKVAINGFGRIGRMIFRAGHKYPDIQFVAINDLSDTKTLAHLLRYDSVHGAYDGEISFDDHSITVNGNKILIFAEKDPLNLPWAKLGIDVVVECTGFFLTKELASKHLKAGAKKVILSADAKDKGIKTLIKGVNEHTYNYASDDIISNASCTSNCTAPIVKVLDDNFGVEQAFFNTVHAVTATQKIHDASDKNLRNARAAFSNIILHSSGAASAVPETIPGIKGIFDGMALRVPVIDGSITILTAVLKKSASVEEMNGLFEGVSKRELKGVMQYSEEPLVSSDIIGNSHSCIIDGEFTKSYGKFVQVLGWYDNEWGYSNRMLDIIRIVMKK